MIEAGFWCGRIRAMEKFLPGSAASESLAYFNYNISNILPFYIAHHYLFVLSFTLIYSPFCSTTNSYTEKALAPSLWSVVLALCEVLLWEWTEDIFKAVARSEPPKMDKAAEFERQHSIWLDFSLKSCSAVMAHCIRLAPFRLQPAGASSFSANWGHWRRAVMQLHLESLRYF